MKLAVIISTILAIGITAAPFIIIDYFADYKFSYITFLPAVAFGVIFVNPIREKILALFYFLFKLKH